MDDEMTQDIQTVRQWLPDEEAREAFDRILERLWLAEESRDIWAEVAGRVVEAAGVDFLVQVPDRIRELRAAAEGPQLIVPHG